MAAALKGRKFFAGSVPTDGERLRHIFITPNTDVIAQRFLTPFQGVLRWGDFPGLKPWARLCSPFGARFGFFVIRI